jgi:tRNA(Ile2)-agmatinylcytidine synthase
VVRTVIQKIIEKYDIIGYPRLVRLNPNVPWKTRGNGALCFRVGKYGGKIKRKIGKINNKDVFCSLAFTKELNENEQKDLATIVKATVESQACIDDENTNPGYVLLLKKPDVELYWKAVTKIVTLNEVQHILHNQQAIFQGYKNRRGLIGATAAISWEPGDKTFELIAYRPQQRWGMKRQIDLNSVLQIDTDCSSTFDNYDARNRHNRIVPNSPCPILYGIRGDDVDELIFASTLVKSESVDSWLLFETNQGTDDHLQKKHIEQIEPFESVVTKGSVIVNPFTIQGGHVLFTIKDKTGMISCAAYEPTKEFRNTVRGLQVGDNIEVYGGVREYPLTINLEKFAIKHLITLLMKIENPVCPICNKHMKSKGTKQGYRCIKCGTTSITPIIHEKPRAIVKGFYEVPVCARRHLSKPLKRLNQET